MEVSRERHQHGSVPKLPRSQGFAWGFRFYITAPGGKRKLKVQTFDSLKYPTERDLRKAVEGQLAGPNSRTPSFAGNLSSITQRFKPLLLRLPPGFVNAKFIFNSTCISLKTEGMP